MLIYRCLLSQLNVRRHSELQIIVLVHCDDKLAGMTSLGMPSSGVTSLGVASSRVTSSGVTSSGVMSSGGVHMKREIGVLSSAAIATGIIIGSGIFVSPVSVVSHTGSVGLSLVLWAAAGGISLMVVLCYGEMTAMFPRAGGEYACFRAMLGPLPAFLHAWLFLVIINPSFHAVLALTAAQYLFKPFFPDCPVPESAMKLTSVWILSE